MPITVEELSVITILQQELLAKTKELMEKHYPPGCTIKCMKDGAIGVVLYAKYAKTAGEMALHIQTAVKGMPRKIGIEELCKNYERLC